jgi:cyclopropane fatty-acyl-phospholipid synthase-like methyltransferase
MYDDIDYSTHYLKYHNFSDKHLNEQEKFYNRILGQHLLGLSKEAKILDFGCGIGLCVNALNKQGFINVEGVDISKEQILLGQAHHINIQHVRDSLKFLEDKKEFYDAIIALDVIEHFNIKDQLKYARAINTALKPDGKLICMVPNANSALSGRWRYIDWTHTSSFTETSLDFLLTNSRFDSVNIAEVEHVRIRPRHAWAIYRPHVRAWLLQRFFRWTRRIMLFSELGEEAWSLPLSPNIMAIAKKKEGGV